MKIGIVDNPYSMGHLWIDYCEQKGIPYKRINCYESNVVAQVSDCDAFMWHYHHAHSKDVLFAKELLYSLETAGKSVYPNFRTSWHFDDKLGQKYLLESLNLPIVPTYAFYSKKDAFDWLEKKSFPIVFKLRGGAGSSNVRIIRNKKHAKRIVKTAFGRGFSQNNKWLGIKERIRKFRNKQDSLFNVVKGIIRFAYLTKFEKVAGRAKGYVYFQDFVSGNDSDTRVIVIAGKAFAIKRLVREDDFRASGSGHIVYEKSQIDENLVKLAFQITDKLGNQCSAIDFIYDNGEPKLVEVSFGFTPEAYGKCPGYWDKDMNWFEGKFNPYGWMVEEVLKPVNSYA